MSLERTAAEIAARKVREAGGSMTFVEYDAAMKGELYFTPIHWIAGWGRLPSERKANHDKLAAFEACKRGLIEQTTEGYKLT